MGIEMKEIAGFENYTISDDGVVFSKKTGTFKKATSNGRGKGYMFVDLYKDGKRKRLYVHRLVAEAFVPNPCNKPYVNHLDGDTRNNKAENLEWCTPLENVEHASKILRVMEGYNNSNYKKHLVKLVTDLSQIYSVDFTEILEKAQKKELKLSWCYVEVQE